MVVWLAFFASVGAAAWTAVTIPKGFFPVEDTGQIQVSTEGPRGASMEAMAELQGRLAEMFGNHPHVANVVSSLGAVGGSISINQGRLFLELKPRDGRPPVTEVIQDLRRRAQQIPGLRVFLDADAEHQFRRAADAHAVPLHAAGPAAGRALRLGAAHGGAAASACRSCRT